MTGKPTTESISALDDGMANDLIFACLKEAPDEWFPRGKWGTIQAVQMRAEKSGDHDAG